MIEASVFLSPDLYKHNKSNYKNTLAVIIDVYRATSSFSVLFDVGLESIIPTAEIDDLLKHRTNPDLLIAAERGGDKLPFADFGNSPTEYLKHDFKGKTIAYSTTNGTRAIEAARNNKKVITACFNNLSAVVDFIINEKVSEPGIICSGWENNPCIEDTLCAGAIIDKIKENTKPNEVFIKNDSANMAYELWKSNKHNFEKLIKKGNHYERLYKRNLLSDLEYCLKIDVSKSVPVLTGDGRLVNGGG